MSRNFSTFVENNKNFTHFDTSKFEKLGEKGTVGMDDHELNILLDLPEVKIVSQGDIKSNQPEKNPERAKDESSLTNICKFLSGCILGLLGIYIIKYFQ